MSETNLPEKVGPNKPPVSGLWKKGISRNPKGRPKNLDSITSVLKEELERVKPDDPEKRTYAQCVVAAAT